MQKIRSLLRGAFLALAISTGAAMLSATPGQAIPSDGGCANITAGSPDGPVACAYCEVDPGECFFVCSNEEMTSGSFDCEGEFD